MLLRKADWHDEDGLHLILEHNADPNLMTRWGDNALHHALRRDNGLVMIEMLLDHGADPTLINTSAGRSATTMAASEGVAISCICSNGVVSRCSWTASITSSRPVPKAMQ